jgi:excisionase family DNA binding protein
MERMHVDLDKPWLTVADICEYMDVSTFVVTSVLRSGELPAVKFGREWRVSRDDFEDWINSQRVDGSQFAVDSSPSDAVGREPSPESTSGN